MSLSLSKLVVTGQALTKTMIDTPLGEIETKFNTTGIATSEIQSSAITTALIADSNVTAAKLASDAVTTAKILDANVTAAKLASDAVTTVKILDANVTTAKLADASVTQAKRAALGQQVSSSCSTFTTSSTSYVDVTNLTVTITTTGRAVLILLEGDGDTNGSWIQAHASASLFYKVMRDSTDLWIYNTNLGGGATPFQGCLGMDVPAAGTYVYKMQAKASSANSVAMTRLKLVAFEL